jgi:hypothetical protein
LFFKDAQASTDINGADDDPMPRYDDTNENKLVEISLIDWKLAKLSFRTFKK